MMARMTDGFHPPVEEYLETIHSLTEEGTPVIQARIAQRMGRTAPSVSEMLDRLTDDGYVRRRTRHRADRTGPDRGRQCHPQTPTGRAPPGRHHRAPLAQGTSRSRALGTRDLRRGRDHLVALLGNPSTCPHGNPIPGAERVDAPPPQVSLADIEPGGRVRLERITEEVELDMASLEYLGQHGCIPGRSALVRSWAPDGTVTLEIDGGTVALGPAITQQMFVAAV